MRELPASREGERVLAGILFDLVRGRVSTPQDLEALTDLGGPVEPILAGLVKVGAIVRDERGDILAAYPLSAISTRHRIELGWFRPWANCAFDALAVPTMVGLKGIIYSGCGHCGAPVRIALHREEVRESQPAEVIVSYGGLANCCDRPSLEVSCPYIHFFCSAEHAAAWARPDGWIGQFLPLSEAVALAVDRFRRIIDLYRRHEPAFSARADSRSEVEA